MKTFIALLAALVFVTSVPAVAAQEIEPETDIEEVIETTQTAPKKTQKKSATTKKKAAPKSKAATKKTPAKSTATKAPKKATTKKPAAKKPTAKSKAADIKKERDAFKKDLKAAKKDFDEGIKEVEEEIDEAEIVEEFPTIVPDVVKKAQNTKVKEKPLGFSALFPAERKKESTLGLGNFDLASALGLFAKFMLP